MRVVKIQNSDTNFRGQVYKNRSLSRLEQNLSDEHRGSLNGIIKGIESSGDNYRWFFEFYKPCDNTVEYAYLDLIKPKGHVYPKIFYTKLEKDSDALKVFEQLREWYIRSMKDYRIITRL